MSHEGDGQLFLPDCPLRPFPFDKRKPAGSVVLVYSALPKGFMIFSLLTLKSLNILHVDVMVTGYIMQE